MAVTHHERVGQVLEPLTPDTPEELVEDACRKACQDPRGNVIYLFVNNGQAHPVLAEETMKQP